VADGSTSDSALTAGLLLAAGLVMMR